MERSLTVLLPVKDAQSTLATTVAEMLDTASDMTEHFELLIIDDGSTDATSEIAYELTRHYPQVRTIRHSRPQGREAAVRTGLAQSRGETVFLREGSHGGWQRLSRLGQPARPNYLGRGKSLSRDNISSRQGPR